MTKANRNDPCPCGSGKKYKKCCGLKELETHKPRLGGIRVMAPSANTAQNPSVNLARKVFKVLTASAGAPKEPEKTAVEVTTGEVPKSYGTLEELIGIEGAPKEVLPPTS